ncbi:hypothetical protein EGT36_28555 [Agrobacterium sp. FDAARGOS_525]|uniref:recombinase family protein n=1 Tax=Agrobacterium sp. FDAARGOS_525 TaxID=2420311 RepID=UPI000F67A4F9|nr:recombinase family protein [Agrobacterium sp. FDAARGOS_525]RSC24779.1 hypothetical protein EGT36_28555 [Agrobacterium sp. FDAARGOS_525]
MKIGYIRLAKAAPTKEEQEEALRASGLPEECRIFVEQIATRRRTEYVDPTPQRTEMISGLKEGDMVYVASASRLGTGVTDIEETLRAINEKGAAVFDAATNEVVRWHPDAGAAISLFSEAITAFETSWHRTCVPSGRRIRKVERHHYRKSGWMKHASFSST